MGVFMQKAGKSHHAVEYSTAESFLYAYQANPVYHAAIDQHQYA